MGHKFRILALLAVLLAAVPAGAQPIPFGFYENAEFSPDFQLLEFSGSSIRFRLDMSRLQPTGTIDFFQRQPGTWADMNHNGHAVLPRFTFYLALPNTGNPTVVIEDWSTISRPATARSGFEAQGPAVQVGDVGIFGGVRLVPVTVKPFTYTNGQNTCQVMSEATIRLDISGGSGDNPLAASRPAFSDVSRRVYKAVVANWENIPNLDVSEPSHMLMIIPDNYIESLSDYVLWKRQLGTMVTIVPASEVASDGTGATMRNRIQQELNDSSPRIDFVTLVGDETVLPVKMRATADPITRFSDFTYPGQFTNEGYFTELEGDDVFPDVFLGRWIVNTQSEALKIASRTMLHERNTFAADSLRFHHCAVAADFTEVTQRMTKQHVREMMLNAGFAEVDTLWGDENPGPQLLLNWLTEGLTYVNYRGSGWNTGWAGISFYVGTIQQINNPGKLPVVTGIGCGVGKFDVPENQCFGEAWMLHGSFTTPQGAAGFLGPCWNTHTAYNDNLDSSLYRAILDYDIGHLMAAFVTGKMFTWAIFEDFVDESAVEEVCQVMFRQYLCLSDPSLQLFTTTPVRVSASFPQAIPAGQYNVVVTIEDDPGIQADSLTVSFSSQAGVVHSGKVPSSAGQWTVPVNFDFGDGVTATLTGQEVLAQQWQIEVSPNGPYLIHSGHVFSESVGNGDSWIQPGETISLVDAVSNIGTETAEFVSGILTTDETFLTIETSESEYGDVAPEVTAEGTPAYVFTVDPVSARQEDFTLKVDYAANGLTPRSYSIFMTLHVPHAATGAVQVADGGNGVLERYEEAGLIFRVSNNGNDTLASSVLTLTTESPYVEVLDGEVVLPALAPGSYIDLPQDAFQISAAGNAPSGVQADFSVALSSDMGTYTYQYSNQFTLTIGVVGTSDPQAGTDGIYYLYDDTDVLYDRVAVYDWLEISPGRGGPGTELDFVQSQQTFNVTVPFSYSYFGTTYSSLSVSTDGWVAPGFTEATSYANQPLPYAPDAVSGMIGVLWNDLWWFWGDTLSDVSYYYDATGDRFVVEWREINPWSTNGEPSTFQVQLLNPTTYPTPTGDAEWLFLYQELTYTAAAASGATIGYENQDETYGGTYYFSQARPATSAPLADERAIRLTTAPPVILSAEHAAPIIPEGFELSQNYPNPFNPETSIEFSLPYRSNVKLEVFDVLGRNVQTLVAGYFEAGRHHVTWNGTSHAGVSVPSGLYFCRMSSPSFVQTRRMLLMR
ncbi:MAG: T9SS type A sorting domain-containing protein [Calditrichaeota bacterium]|nr:T9SS type A sorting domain-containing protein [Calditrichota bacterium]MCB9391104.1 T9SS type A sorting domain-containing protein [Calditrichota bacterium]